MNTLNYRKEYPKDKKLSKEEIYKDVLPFLSWMISKKYGTLNKQDFNDMVQDAWIIVFESWKKWEPAKSGFLTYLTTNLNGYLPYAFRKNFSKIKQPLYETQNYQKIKWENKVEEVVEHFEKDKESGVEHFSEVVEKIEGDELAGAENLFKFLESVEKRLQSFGTDLLINKITWAGLCKKYGTLNASKNRSELLVLFRKWINN